MQHKSSPVQPTVSESPKVLQTEIKFTEWTSQQAADYYRQYGHAQKLSLDFKYNFPDTILLGAGEGYLAQSDGRLIPSQDTFSLVNTVKGFAMQGLFRLYDVNLQGQLLDFSQCMDNAMGSQYVQVVSICRPAQIQESSESGYYTLSRKGLLCIKSL